MAKKYDGLYDLILRDQFFPVCNIKRTPKTLSSMAELDDQYKDARDLTAIQVTQTGMSKILQKKPESNVNQKEQN